VGFGSDRNEVIIVGRDGSVERPRRASKLALARRIVKQACAARAGKMEQP
jgi:phosphopantothenoylcysteine synthetase/decarboxylase